jgi:hypothetical protein
MKEKKEKKKISTVLLLLFLIIIFVIGVSIYGLKNYYFINVQEVFNSDDSIQAVTIVTSKNKKLKLPNFSVLESDKFNVLEEGYWYEFDDADFELGNDHPFERIVEEEEREDIK